VATREGVYIYDAKDKVLNPVLAGDFRAATGTQSFVKDAAVNLVYVSNLSKTDNAASSEAEMYTAADVGFIAQNVYLYCASEGLATVVRGSIDKPALAKTLNLQANQKSSWRNRWGIRKSRAGFTRSSEYQIKRSYRASQQIGTTAQVEQCTDDYRRA
jgi:nitroreductase